MSSSGKYRLGQLKGFSLFYFTWTFVAVFLVKMIEHLVPIIWAVLLKIALLTEIWEGVRKCALKMIVFLYNLTNMPRLVRPCKSSWFWLPLATYTFFQQFFLNKLNKQTNKHNNKNNEDKTKTDTCDINCQIKTEDILSSSNKIWEIYKSFRTKSSSQNFQN